MAYGKAEVLGADKQLTVARMELENAIAALPDPVTQEAWDRVQNAAAAYKQLLERAYGISIDQTAPADGDDQMAWLDLSGWEPPDSEYSLRQHDAADDQRGGRRLTLPFKATLKYSL